MYTQTYNGRRICIRIHTYTHIILKCSIEITILITLNH